MTEKEKLHTLYSIDSMREAILNDQAEVELMMTETGPDGRSWSFRVSTKTFGGPNNVD